MKELIKSILQLNSFRLYREFVYFVGGFTFLLCLNLFYRPNLEAFPNINLLGNLGRYFVVFSVTYFVGKLLFMMGEFLGTIIIKLVSFIFLDNRKKRLKEYFNKLLRYIRKANTNYISKDELEYKTLNLELDELIENSRLLQEYKEIDKLYGIFLKILISYSLFISLAISWKFIILILFFTFLLFRNNIDCEDFRREIFEFFVKKN